MMLQKSPAYSAEQAGLSNLNWEDYSQPQPQPQPHPQLFPQPLFEPQPQQKMMIRIRMIHRQLLLPLFHIVFHLTRLSLGYLMWEEGKKQLDRKNLFYA